MKHLKKFNESKLGDELEDFCKEYLAYLTDGKFECYVNSNSINTHITILERDYNAEFFPGRSKRFYWNEIEDDFIPFLQILSEKYVIAQGMIILESYEPVTTMNISNKGFSIGLVLEGGIPEYATCMGVTLEVNRKISHTDIR
jgi:hypothetical protein